MARSRYEHDPHWHVCPTCRQRYEDTCADEAVNARCSSCRIGMGWQLLRRNREPRDCCVAHSRVASKDDRKRLKLTGATDWWICRECGRTQGYNPAIKVYRSTPTTPKETS